MGKSFPFDYEINWDKKKNHAVGSPFLLGAKSGRIETVDTEANASAEDLTLRGHCSIIRSGLVWEPRTISCPAYEP